MVHRAFSVEIETVEKFIEKNFWLFCGFHWEWRGFNKTAGIGNSLQPSVKVSREKRCSKVCASLKYKTKVCASLYSKVRTTSESLKYKVSPKSVFTNGLHMHFTSFYHLRYFSPSKTRWLSEVPEYQASFQWPNMIQSLKKHYKSNGERIKEIMESRLWWKCWYGGNISSWMKYWAEGIVLTLTFSQFIEFT